MRPRGTSTPISPIPPRQRHGISAFAPYRRGHDETTLPRHPPRPRPRRAGIGIGASVAGDCGQRHDHVVVTNVGGDAAHAGQTIVVTDGGWHHGFPFGLLFLPFLVLFLIAVLRRGRRGCGPWTVAGRARRPTAASRPCETLGGMAQTILVVEDEPGIARLVRRLPRARGLPGRDRGDGRRRARAGPRSARPALVVLDLGLPDRDGLDVTRELRRVPTCRS